MNSEEIIKDLNGYSATKKIDEVEIHDSVKYLRKDTKKYIRNAYLLSKDDENGNMLLLSGRYKWNVKYDDVILFKKKV
jgi:hypothetical protein